MRIAQRTAVVLLASYLLLTAVPLVLGYARAATDPPTRYEQGDEHIAKTGSWADFTKLGLASGESYGRSATISASATVYFEGTQIDYIAMTGRTPGVVDIYLDGRLKTTIDLYSSSAHYNQKVWSSGSIPSGSHKLELKRSTTSLVSEYLILDALDIVGHISDPPPGPTRYEQTDSRIAYTGSWSDFTKLGLASGESYGRSATLGASATIYFTGTQLDWIAMKGTTTGIADVYLDGTFQETIDLSASTASYQVNVWSTGELETGPHYVQIVRNQRSGTDKYLTLDAILVVGAITSGPPRVTSLTPDWGSPAGGTTVLISGTGLADVSAVTFGGVPAASYSVGSNTAITAVAPAHPEGTATVCVTTSAGTSANSAANTASIFTYSATPPLTRYEQTDSRIAYTGSWSDFTKLGLASGESYGRSATLGASATIYFTGTQLDWIAMKGTTTGIADVYLDGTFQETIDLSASTASYQVNVWSTGELETGPHYVQIVRNQRSGTDKYLTLDAFEVWGAIDVSAPCTEESDPRLSYTGDWTFSNTPLPSGGSFATTDSVGSSVTVKFEGTRVTLLATKSPASGIANVSVDGAPPDTVDLYSDTTCWRQQVWESASLASGPHSVTFFWTGTKTSAATGTAINADSFKVVGTLLTAAPPIDLLSPAQLAGQRLIYSYSGLTPPSSLVSLISQGQVAGVIFFGGNISSISQIKSVCAQLEAANASPTNPIRAPLLLVTDQEGGMVRRLPGPPTISAKEIGASSDPGGQATQTGTAAGGTLMSAGMNVNLAPVLDVYRQPGNFIDSTKRSFSNDPAIVSLCGANFITAQQSVGPAAAAKHFPGLGAAAYGENSDRGYVSLDVSLDALRSIDELPYAAAISAGVRLVMLSWAVYPALDPTRPAGFSSTIVRDELRGRLGFTGVTITDALEAASLQAYGSTRNRAVLAAGAGVDLILCSGSSVPQGQSALAGLQSAYVSGALPMTEFQTAAQRVIALRTDLGD